MARRCSGFMIAWPFSGCCITVVRAASGPDLDTVVVSSAGRRGEAPTSSYYLRLYVDKVRARYCLMDPAGEILRESSAVIEEIIDVVPDADGGRVLEATGSWHADY